jgi:hypothetical protein
LLAPSALPFSKLPTCSGIPRGQPLDSATRAFFEPRLGRDLSDVRTHTGPLASQSANAVNALAYTAGSDIVFQQSAYSPSSHQGRHLLAHELAHFAQQNGGVSRAPLVQRQVQDQAQGQQGQQGQQQGQPQDNTISVALQTNCNDDLARMIGLYALNAQRMLQAALDWFRASDPVSDIRLNALLRSHFGSASDSTRSTVHDLLAKVSTILEAITKGNVNLNCVDAKDEFCNKREYYAYVHQGQGYQINFCKLFFTSVMSDPERIWGIIHETCHLAGAHGDDYIFTFGALEDSICFNGDNFKVAAPLQNADSFVNFIWCLVKPGSTVSSPGAQNQQGAGATPSASTAS